MEEFAKAADRAMSRFLCQSVGTPRQNFQIQQLEKEVKDLKLKVQCLISQNFRPQRPYYFRPRYFQRNHNRFSMYPSNQNLRWNNPVDKLWFYDQRFGQNARECVRACIGIRETN